MGQPVSGYFWLLFLVDAKLCVNWCVCVCVCLSVCVDHLESKFRDRLQRVCPVSLSGWATPPPGTTGTAIKEGAEPKNLLC